MNLLCTIYAKGSEATGMLVNICEDGLALMLSESDFTYMDLMDGDEIVVQFIDENCLRSSSTVEDILATFMIVHHEKTEDGYQVGCKLKRDNARDIEYTRYVELKKSVDFLNRKQYRDYM